MANYTNSFYDYITSKQTVPASSNVSGTITTANLEVHGVGTLFKSEMPVGSWIYNASLGELRKVIRVDSDTFAVMTNKFTIDIGGATVPNVIPASHLNCSQISVQVVPGQAAGSLNGKTFPALGNWTSFTKSSRDESSRRDLIDPIIVDASGTQIVVLITR